MAEKYDTESKQLTDALRTLETISARCASTSARVGMMTLAHLIIVLIFGFSISGPNIFGISYDTFRVFLLLLLLFDAFILFGTILFAWNFDRLTRIGNLIYQEISDEVEKGDDSRINTLQVRVALRKFVLDATLPFYRKGENGPAAYIFTNILFSLFVWGFVSLHR